MNKFTDNDVQGDALYCYTMDKVELFYFILERWTRAR